MASLEELQQQLEAAKERLRNAERFQQQIRQNPKAYMTGADGDDPDNPKDVQRRIAGADKEVTNARSEVTSTQSLVTKQTPSANTKQGQKSQAVIDEENRQREANAKAGKGSVTDKERADAERADANTRTSQANAANAVTRTGISQQQANTAATRAQQTAQQNAIMNQIRGQQLANTSAQIAIRGAQLEQTAIKNQADALYHAGLLSNQRRTQLGKEAETEFKGQLDGIKVVVDAAKAAQTALTTQRAQDASMANTRLNFVKSLMTTAMPIVARMMATIPAGSHAPRNFLVGVLSAANTAAKEMGGLRELAHIPVFNNLLKVAGYPLPDALPTFPTAAELDWRTAVSLAASGMPPVGWRGPIGVEALKLARQRPQEAQALAKNAKLPDQDSQGRKLPGNPAVTPDQVDKFVKTEAGNKIANEILNQEAADPKVRTAMQNVQKLGAKASKEDQDIVHDANLRAMGRLELAASGRPWNDQANQPKNAIPAPSSLVTIMNKIDPELRPLASATYALALQKQASGQALSKDEQTLVGAIRTPEQKQALMEAWSPQRIGIVQRMVANQRAGKAVGEGLSPDEVKSVQDGYLFASSRIAGRWVDGNLKPGPNGEPPQRPPEVPADWQYKFVNGKGIFYDPKNPLSNVLKPPAIQEQPAAAPGTPKTSTGATPVATEFGPRGPAMVADTVDLLKSHAMEFTRGGLPEATEAEARRIVKAAVDQGKSPAEILAQEKGVSVQQLRDAQKKHGVYGNAQHPDEITSGTAPTGGTPVTASGSAPTTAPATTEDQIANNYLNKKGVPQNQPLISADQAAKGPPTDAESIPRLGEPTGGFKPGGGPTDQNRREMNIAATFAKLNESLGMPQNNEDWEKRHQEAIALVDSGKGAMQENLEPSGGQQPTQMKSSLVDQFRGMPPEQVRDRIYDAGGVADLVAQIQSGQKTREELSPFERKMLEIAEDKVRDVTAALQQEGGQDATPTLPKPTEEAAAAVQKAGEGTGEEEVGNIFGTQNASNPLTDYWAGILRRKNRYEDTFGANSYAYEPTMSRNWLTGEPDEPQDTGMISLDLSGGDQSDQDEQEEPQTDILDTPVPEFTVDEPEVTAYEDAEEDDDEDEDNFLDM